MDGKEMRRVCERLTRLRGNVSISTSTALAEAIYVLQGGIVLYLLDSGIWVVYLGVWQWVY